VEETVKQKMAMFRDLLTTMRPRQWSKNVFVLAGVVFSRELFNPVSLTRSMLALVLFCMASSAVYLINDVSDIERDRAHPVKRNRPLAAGRLRPLTALLTAALLIAIATPSAFFLSPLFGATLLVYLGLMTLYSFALKNLVILDVLTISLGFVLRAVGGTLVVGVVISPWLLVCMILLALFLGLAKRRHELLLLETGAGEHRRILQEYSSAVLDQMITVVSATTLMAYTLYTYFAHREPGMTTEIPYIPDVPFLMFTIPFVIYAIFRYLYLVYQKNKGGSPEEILLHDIPFLIDMVLWGLSVLVILYFVPAR
jgi:4-hydroxybenzoate polyprenyltransferase